MKKATSGGAGAFTHMTNEEKLREALSRLLAEIPVVRTSVFVEAREHASQVLKETAPVKPEHPAIKAFYDWYIGESLVEPEDGIDKVLQARRRETFLAGYKAGIESIIKHLREEGADSIGFGELERRLKEVPTI